MTCILSQFQAVMSYKEVMEVMTVEVRFLDPKESLYRDHYIILVH